MREVESRQSYRVERSLVTQFKADGEPKRAGNPPQAKGPRAKKARPRVEGQREMLLPIAGKKAAEENKPVQAPTPRSKAS